jgi:integrase
MAWEAAEDIEAKSGEDAKGRFLGAVFATGKTFDELFDEWIKQTEYRDSTKATYRLAYGELRAALGLTEGDSLLLDEINDTNVASFVFRFLPSQGLSNKAIATRLGGLSSMWTYAQQRLAVPPGRNPWQGHKLPRSGKKRDTRAFTDAELVTLLHGTPKVRAWERYPRVRDLMLIGLYTGARLNELCSLLVGDVAVAKDSASATLAIREGKTNAATRTLAVTHWAVLAMLKRRLTGKKPSAQLFEELRPGGAADQWLSLGERKAQS